MHFGCEHIFGECFYYLHLFNLQQKMCKIIKTSQAILGILAGASKRCPSRRFFLVSDTVIPSWELRYPFPAFKKFKMMLDIPVCIRNILVSWRVFIIVFSVFLNATLDTMFFRICWMRFLCLSRCFTQAGMA